MTKFLHLQKEDKNALLTFLDARIAKKIRTDPTIVKSIYRYGLEKKIKRFNW